MRFNKCYKPIVIINKTKDDDDEYIPNFDEEETESEYDTSEDEISDSEDGSNYESETEPESEDEDTLHEPKPFHGNGFTVFFETKEDKKDFLKQYFN